MGKCNYCVLQQIRTKAFLKDHKIVMKPSKFQGGYNVFSIPKNEELPSYKEPSNEQPNGDEIFEHYCVGWLLAIPKRCVCFLCK